MGNEEKNKSRHRIARKHEAQYLRNYARMWLWKSDAFQQNIQGESRNITFKVPDESSNYLAYKRPKVFLIRTEIFLNDTDKVEKFI